MCSSSADEWRTYYTQQSVTTLHAAVAERGCWMDLALFCATRRAITPVLTCPPGTMELCICCLRLCLINGHFLWDLLTLVSVKCHADWLVLHSVWVFMGPHWMAAALRDS